MDVKAPPSSSEGDPTDLLLVRYHNSSAAEEMERRRRDAELLDRIRLEHALRDNSGRVTGERATNPMPRGTSKVFTTQLRPLPCPEYEVLSNRLVDFAVPLFKKLLRTGSIKKLLVTRHLPNNLTSDDYERLHTSRVARDELALLIVAKGEEYLRLTVIPQGKWDPNAGATLETYFVNGCLFKFADSVRTWKKDHPEWSGAMPADLQHDRHVEAEMPDPRSSDMIDAVEDRDLVRRLIATAPPTVKVIMQLMLEDLTFAEIGERLNLSARAVEGRLHRFRAQVKKDARRRRFDLPHGLATSDAA